MDFFYRLNVICRVLKNFEHFVGLFNHSTLSGICQIVTIFSIHNLVANQFLFKRDRLVKLTELEIFDENRAI